MPINLSKGQKVDLTKGNPGLKNVMVGLGWDVNAFDSGSDFDLDAAAFMLGSNGKCPTEKEFVFYGNLEHPSGSIKHMGDNLTGEGEGDDEQIEVKFQLLTQQTNLQKDRYCFRCFNENIRGDFFGIKWYSKGDEYWQGANKSDENGCVGCPWYDLADWKKKFNEHLSQE